jgi:hypothetical protein
MIKIPDESELRSEYRFFSIYSQALLAEPVQKRSILYELVNLMGWFAVRSKWARLGSTFLATIDRPLRKKDENYAPSRWRLAVLLISLCSSALAAEPVAVRTLPLSKLAIYPESAAPAVVVSLNDSPIASQVDAPVVEILVRVGDTVKAGAVLVKLDCRDFELERARLQAERQATQARLELAEWQVRRMG